MNQDCYTRLSALLLAALAAPGLAVAGAEPPILKSAESLPDRHPGAAAIELARPQDSSAQSELALSHALETLSNNTNDWLDTQLEWLHQYAPRKVLIARATASQRFGLHDNTVGLSGYYPLGARTTLYAEMTVSDTHQVLPRDSLHLQLARSLSDGWGVLGGMRHVSYNTTSINIADLTLERYFSNYRLAFTAYPSRSQIAGSASSYRLQFSRYYGDENNIQFLIVRGTEVDKPTGVDSVLATSVRSEALFGRHWLTRSVGIDYGLGHTVQGATTRRAARLGLRYRF